MDPPDDESDDNIFDQEEDFEPDEDQEGGELDDNTTERCRGILNGVRPRYWVKLRSYPSDWGEVQIIGLHRVFVFYYLVREYHEALAIDILEVRPVPYSAWS